MLICLEVLCGGDYGGVVAAREIPVAVGKVDWRVLLVLVGTEVGLVTCEWSRTTPVSRRPTRSITLKVMTEIKWAMKRQEGNGQKGHLTRT